MKDFSQGTRFLLFNHQTFLLKHSQTLLTWLQQPTFLHVEWSSSFYWCDAEDSPSIGNATCRKMKLTFLVHQVVCKGHRIRPFLDYWINPMQPVTSTFTTTVQQEQSNNWITIYEYFRSLCMHDCLVAAFLVVRPAG